MAYQQKTIFILYIIIIVLNLLIYINSEYIFNMLLYYLSRDVYNGSLLNVGYAPLSFGNTCDLKYSNELYTKILNLFKKHVDDLSKLTIVEVPCVNVNSGTHILSKFNPQKVICITPHAEFKETVDSFKNSNKQLEYILGTPNELNNLEITKKNIDIVLSIESSRLKYNYNELSTYLSTFIQSGKYWIIADIFESNKIKQVQTSIKKNKFSILETVNITKNILNSLECDSDRKETFINNFPIIKEYMQNIYITKKSKLYNELQNNTKQYLVIISKR